MIKRILSICCLIAALVLMALPSIPMVFAPNEYDRIIFYFSYFSPMHIGRAGNLFPMAIAFLTILTIVVLVIEFRKDTKNNVPFCIISCIVVTIISWILWGMTGVIGIIVMILHITVLLLQIKRKKHINITKINQ